MVEYLRKLWSDMLGAGDTIPPGKKAGIALMAVIVLGGILGIAYMASKPDYRLLYSGLALEDVNAVTTRLTENNTPYQLSPDGTAIFVPADQALELRLDMATAGIPSGGSVGFEIFDKSAFGMTDFVQKLNFKRALQGELARTINQFREVKASRVHIAIPEKRLFSDDNNKPKASVIVKLASGRRLKKDSVKAISHLVASSVEGLNAENITVVDVEGNVLAGGEPSDEMALRSSTQLEYRANVEKSLEKRITSMLERVTGMGKVVTRVSALIDFKRVERTEKKYDPDSQVARSEQRSESKSSGEQAPFGVPGVSSNVPNGEKSGVSSGKPATSTNLNETTNYEIDEFTSRIIEETGLVKKLSIAVMVDGKYATGDNGESQFTARTAEEIKQITDLVKTAAGIDEKRGDSVVVESARFDSTELDMEIESAKGEADRQLYATIVKYTGMVALAMILFLFIARPVIKSITAASVDIEALRTFPQTVEQMEAKYGTAPEKDIDYRTRVTRAMEEDPAAAATMVRDWLRTRR